MSGRGRKGDREAARAALRAAVFRAGPGFSLEPLRETCRDAFARGPSDDELLDLMLQHLAAEPAENPVARELERTIDGLGARSGEWETSNGNPFPDPRSTLATPVVDLVLRFLDALLRERVGKALGEVAALDPCAGGCDFLARMPGRAYGFEPSLTLFYEACRRAPGATLGFADPLVLTGRGATASFDFFESENAACVRAAREAEVAAIVGRPPAPTAARLFRWSVERLRRTDGSPGTGVVAFVTDTPLGLEAEPSRVFELDLREEWGAVATFLVREPGDRRVYRPALGEPLPEGPEDVPWSAPGGEPPGWAEALPLEGERGIFRLGTEGVASGRDAWAWDEDREALRAKVARTAAFYHAESARLAGYAGRHAVRRDDGLIRWTPTLEAKLRRRAKIAAAPPLVRGLRKPFAPAWLALDSTLLDRIGPWARVKPDPCLIVARAPFSVWVTNAVPDARALGPTTRCFPLSEGVSPSALARFRGTYGAGVTERNVFDAVVALLHHPACRERYGEAIRREGPRVPLPTPEALAPLLDAEEAPPVGEGTAFGTGWLRAEAFEVETLPDYDDPFASPYARGDVDRAFLLLAGLGAAFAILQSNPEAILPYALKEEPFVKGRLRRGAIPEAALAYEVAGKNPVGWAVARVRAGAVSMEDATVEIGRAVAILLEVVRLTEIVGRIELP